MTLPSGYSISPMTDDEVTMLGDWAAEEGWNPGLADLDLAQRVDPDAFIALRLGSALAGGGSIFSYDGRFGFMGLFIMRGDLRNRGCAGVLADAAAAAGAHRLRSHRGSIVVRG